MNRSRRIFGLAAPLRDRTSNSLTLATLMAGRSNDNRPWGPKWTPRELVEFISLAAALLDATQKLHDEGFQGSFLHPAYILVNIEDGENLRPQFVINRMPIQASTFLIASPVESETIAKYAYLPPEFTGYLEATGTAASDLYSIGAILYEAACGVHLFQATSVKDLIHKILSQVPTLLSILHPDFPAPLAAVIGKLLRKNPADRYLSVQGLRADLDHCLIELSKGVALVNFALGRQDPSRELKDEVPFIGRARERSRLEQGLDLAKVGVSGCVFVMAPSGTGKTRLTRFATDYAQELNISVRSIKFSHLDKNIPLGALRPLLEEFRKDFDTLNAVAQASWKKELYANLQGSCQLLRRRLPMLTYIFADAPALEDLGFEEEELLFHQAILKLLVSPPRAPESCIVPQLFVMDDLQWADDRSLHVVEQALLFKEKPALNNSFFIFTYRSEEVDASHVLSKMVAKISHKDDVMRLASLDVKETELLVSVLLDEPIADIRRTVELTFRYTRGNPFYVREFLKILLPTISISGAHWHIDESRLQASLGSHSLLDVVLKRFESLSVPARLLLQAASIIGHSVSISDLQILLTETLKMSSPEHELSQDFWSHSREIDDLSRERFIFLENNRVVFFHDKIREAAYALMTPTERMHRHLTYGKHLAHSYKILQNPDKVSVKIIFEAAYHFSNVNSENDVLLARSVLLLAGEKARSLFAFVPAVEYLRGALALFPPSGVERESETLAAWIRVQNLLADVYASMGRTTEAFDMYESTLKVVADPIQRAEIYVNIAERQFNEFQYKKSSEAAKSGIKVLKISYFRSSVSAVFDSIFAILAILMIFPILKRCGINSSKTITSKRKSLEFKLYFILANTGFYSSLLQGIYYILTFRKSLYFYSENEYKALSEACFSCLAASVGFHKSAQKGFQKSFDYFERNPNPVAKGFILLGWGILLDFKIGNVHMGMEKLERGHRILKGVGENFWRANCASNYLYASYFHPPSIRQKEITNDLLSICKESNVGPVGYSAAVRILLLSGRMEEFERSFIILTEGCMRMLAEKQHTIEVSISFTNIGMIYLLLEDHKGAIEALLNAMHVIKLSKQITSNACFAPFLLTQAYTRAGLLQEAQKCLSKAKLLSLSYSVLKLPVAFAKGELLIAQGCIQQGIEILRRAVVNARAYGWHDFAASGDVLIGQGYMRTSTEEAIVYLERAKSYFLQTGQEILRAKCDRLIRVALESSQYGVGSPTDQMHLKAIRRRVQSDSLFDIILKLSSITDFKELFPAILEAFCICTGADHAVVFLPMRSELQGSHEVEKGIQNTWRAEKALGVEIGMEGEVSASYDDFPWAFVNESMESISQSGLAYGGGAWRVRSTGVDQSSAMVFALAYKEQLAGFIYLGHRSLVNLFDHETAAISLPLGKQAAIAIENINLLAEVKAKALQEEKQLRAEILVRKARLEELGHVAIVLGDQINTPLNVIKLCSEQIAEMTAEDLLNGMHLQMAEMTSNATDRIKLTMEPLKAFRVHAPQGALEMQLGTRNDEDSLVEGVSS